MNFTVYRKLLTTAIDVLVRKGKLSPTELSKKLNISTHEAEIILNNLNYIDFIDERGII
ncbi:MAG: hypothetical protein RXQ99_08220 [Acidianus sp.]